MYKVVFDCDNTMGVFRSDIDDGLTFAYLYAHPDIYLMGVTCTFANNQEDVVYHNTLDMLRQLNIRDIAVFEGGKAPQDYDSAAVDFLVRTVDKNPNEITVLATGSLCNIAGAFKKDPEFFEKVRGIIVMGGILEPLYLNGILCNELNFSIDYRSAAEVIYHCNKLTIISSQCSQHAVFGEREIEQLCQQNTTFMKFSLPLIQRWIRFIAPAYGNRSVFINWDLCTAIYLTHPEFFHDTHKRVIKKEENLKTGWLETDETNSIANEHINLVTIPDTILDIDAFNADFFKTLSRMK